MTIFSFNQPTRKGNKKQQIMRQFKQAFLIYFLIVFTSICSISAQAIVCNSDAEYNLMVNESIQFFPSDFLEMGPINNSDFALEIKDSGGNVVLNNRVYFKYQTNTYTATVTNLSSQNKCWTEFKVIPDLSSTVIICDADLKFCMGGGSKITMLPTDFLDMANVRDQDYILEIKDENNNVVPNNLIMFHSQPKSYLATITNIFSLNKCWVDFEVLPRISTHPLAICKTNIVSPLSPNKTNIYPWIVDNSSKNFVSLKLNKQTFDCDNVGKNKVKLSAISSDNIINQCECEIDVQDKTPPRINIAPNITVDLDSNGFYFFQKGQIPIDDNCQIASLTISPEFISCLDSNPKEVTFTAKDNSGGTTWVKVNVHYIQSSNPNPVMVCNDNIEIIVRPNPVTIFPHLVLEGNGYGCMADYEVTLSYNGIKYPKPEVTNSDAGKVLIYEVQHKSSGEKCWGTITAKKSPGCDETFRVCDKTCPNGTPGDCNSGYTNDDNLDWPCNIEVELCGSENAFKISPADLVNLHNISPENSQPQVINYNCDVVYMAYIDQSIVIGGIGSPNRRIVRTWTVLNWLTTDIYTYIQFIEVKVVTPTICDTKPWNTPVGDCASGHTLSDAVEWPADITISQSGVSLTSLRNNPNVHPNDVEPALVENCSSSFQKTFTDFVTDINVSTKKIERTWNILLWNASMTILYTYKQYITVTDLEQTGVCIYTFNGKPVKDAVLGHTFGKTSGNGCASFTSIPNTDIIPSKNGNPREGLDVMDLIAAYEYVLGIRTLNPYQIMAADITTGWNAISTVDLVLLQKMVNGEISEWPDNIPEWRFIDADHQFENGMPSPARNFINTDNLINSNRFIGIKTGDIDGSFNEEPDFNKPVFAVLKAVDESLTRGESYEISFSSDRTQNIAAIKLEFEIEDNGVYISDITSNALPGFSMDKNVEFYGSKILVTWYIDLLNTPSGANLRNNQDLLTFHFTSNKNSIASSILGLSEDFLQQIKPVNGEESMNVGLYWENQIINGVKDGVLSSLVVSPNPFSEYIMVLGVENDAVYQLSSINGQNLFTGILDKNGQIQTENLENGFYILTITEQGKKPSIHKVVKVR